ncbi:molecular chaperone GrpE [Amphibacillus marinus]|uniref:Protein GrpE n=1 Tax=Amphibacillus marinus TaxID=872970 RepID=A0A1H8NSF1_9BACI|nr:nucleotide exchange factor GrpE [Amphibacillus marinus]SEO32313.1 molecular chaperone GrpE [Amphibacillus marinus]
MEEKNNQGHDEELVEEVEEVEAATQELVDEPSDNTEVELANQEDYEKVVQEKNELYDKFLRLQAEYDNFRKRTQREKAADLKYKSQGLATELLPVVDNFERALQTKPDSEATKAFIDGIEMVYRQLVTALEKEGIEAIPTVGEEFDPNLHQAVLQVDDPEFKSNTVVEEMQKGYQLKDRVIRPAMVKVNQ